MFVYTASKLDGTRVLATSVTAEESGSSWPYWVIWTVTNWYGDMEEREFTGDVFGRKTKSNATPSYIIISASTTWRMLIMSSKIKT